MTRLGMVAAAAATLAAVVLAPTVGQAQSVDAAARDLRTHDVTFENGAVTDQDLADIDRVTAQLQADGGYTKVVVLAHPVDTSSSARGFAGKVLDTLGGRGRVIVFDPRDVGIATNVPGEASKVNSAELAAIDAANRSNSFATGVLGAADTLGVKGSAGSGSGTGGSGGGQDLGAPGGSTGSILPVVLLVAVVGLVGVGFYFWWSSRKRKAAAAASSVSQAEGEQTVRGEVEATSNLVIDLADRTEVPGAPAEAVAAFRDGASEFATLQDDLEGADTRQELEAVYPRLVHARWKLECSKALLDGQPAPAEPTPGPLFPPPPPPPPGAAPVPSAPEPHYQRHTQHSPWLTDAAITAITVLASRGLASARSSPRRQPSDDVWFRDRYGGSGGGGGSRGGGRQSGSQSRPPISMGGQRGRGMGDR
jgi:uncharacterized membrane protein YgcG